MRRRGVGYEWARGGGEQWVTRGLRVGEEWARSGLGAGEEVGEEWIRGGRGQKRGEVGQSSVKRGDLT